jgi:hypothetical protein
MAGLEPTPAPAPQDAGAFGAAAGRRRSADRAEGSVESLLAMSDSVRPSTVNASSANAARARAASRPSGDPPTQPVARRGREDAQLPTQPSQLKKVRASLHSAPQVTGRRGAAGLWVVVALLAVVAGGFAVWQLRPSEVDPKAAPAAAVPSASADAPKAAPACKATLVVTDVPTKAEVLLHEGQAPVDVEKMPVGARLEFVATAEGFAPKRVVVPAGATWDPGADGKPRFETAVQLEKSSAKAGANDAWPPAEPGTEVGGQGPPGTIHVVATPRGAEVWMLAGMGPEARVEQLRCDKDVEVLVAGPGPYRKRLRVAAADFAVDATPPPPGKAATRLARISAR